MMAVLTKYTKAYNCNTSVCVSNFNKIFKTKMKNEILKFENVPKELKKQRVRRRILMIFPYYQLIAILLVFAGLCSWFTLPLFNKNTYVSENALMPGQGRSLFNSFDKVDYYYKTLKKNVTLEEAYALITDNPMHQLYAKHDNYMLLRTMAPRGDGSETLLFYTSLKSPFACAVLMAYFKDLQSRNYLAKDVLFLITNDEPTGSLQFVKDWYHSNKNLIWNRPGQIEAALGLFIDQPEFDTFSVKFTGHQPRLPNLDIMNILVRIARMYSLRVSLHGDMAIGGNTYFDYLRRMAYMTGSLIIGDFNEYSAHSNFGTVGLDAITIHCTNLGSKATLYDGDGGQPYKKHTVKQVVLLLDMMHRSLNNNLQKYYRSFYFYILSSHVHYISIADMSIPIGLFLLALVLSAVALWYYSDSGYAFQKYIPRHTSESRPVVIVFKCVLIPLAVTLSLFGVISAIKQSNVIANNIVLYIYLVISCTCSV